MVHYQCDEGYRIRSLKNHSVCGENGQWEDIDLWCEGATFDDRSFTQHQNICSIAIIISLHSPAVKEDLNMLFLLLLFSLSCIPTVCANLYLYAEISCGPPLSPPNTNVLWDHASRPGSVVLYECMDGFYMESGNNISICSISGVWGEVTVKCKGKATVCNVGMLLINCERII